MHPSLPSTQPSPTSPQGPLHLAALARQGSAVALQRLTAQCLCGAPADRVVALRLLPGLIPFQPVWHILDQADRPGAPALVRRVVAQVRRLVDDPRDCEPIYRAVQRTLVRRFIEAERRSAQQHREQRRRRPRPLGPQPAALRLSESVVRAIYDYRFEMSDGCLGDLREHHVEEFLSEYAPRRLLIAKEEWPQVPRVLVRHICWLRQIGHLLPQRAHRLCLLSLQHGRRYLQAPSAGIRFRLRTAAAEGVDITDERAVRRHLLLQELDLHEEFAPVFWP
ncbi:MAG: hypothetical protein RMK29_04020 [Myxococcales bacterium]|nr:hypothetical protein [Myxococcota bacterium]MDW8280854.1 hypothetical protein [Myxococcales bacterium]